MIARGRDAKILGELAESHGAEVVKAALPRYLALRDPFVIEAGYSIPVFRARFGGLELSKNGAAKTGINAAWEGQPAGEVKL